MRIASLLFVPVASAALSAQPAMLFHNVRIFDGERASAGRDVIVQGGKIARIGAKLTAPPNATVIDGTSKTLLPGLIDAHTHAWGTALTNRIEAARIARDKGWL